MILATPRAAESAPHPSRVVGRGGQLAHLFCVPCGKLYPGCGYSQSFPQSLNGIRGEIIGSPRGHGGMSNLQQLAKARRETDEAYSKAFRATVRTLTPMTTEDFWKVIPLLGERLEADRDVDAAMHNFMCNNVYQSYGECTEPFEDLSSPVAWELAVRFLNKYEEIKSTLYKKCHDLRGLERGDDGGGGARPPPGSRLDCVPAATRNTCPQRTGRNRPDQPRESRANQR